MSKHKAKLAKKKLKEREKMWAAVSNADRKHEHHKPGSLNIKKN